MSNLESATHTTRADQPVNPLASEAALPWYKLRVGFIVKFFLIFFGAIGGLALIGMLSNGVSRAWSSQARSELTRGDFELISSGMSYEQVCSAIGKQGELVSTSDVAGYTTTLFAWKNANGSNMTAMFQNGRMISKAQFGLK